VLPQTETGPYDPSVKDGRGGRTVEHRAGSGAVRGGGPAKSCVGCNGARATVDRNTAGSVGGSAVERKACEGLAVGSRAVWWRWKRQVTLCPQRKRV